MARPSNSFVRSLIRYGNASPTNLANLETWHSAVIEEIAENKGGQMVSGSTNGSSFTQVTSMTNSEWAAVLNEVLDHIENCTRPISRTIARLC